VRLTTGLVCLAAVLAGGCNLPWGETPPLANLQQTAEQAPAEPASDAPADPAASTAVASEGPAPTPPLVMVRVRLLRIELPLGTASESRRLWSYVNEERVHDAPTPDSAPGPEAPRGFRSDVSLAANGLRIGVVGREAADDLSALLEGLLARRRSESMAWLLPGRPQQIQLLEGADTGTTLFTYYRDRTLSGSDYPPCDGLLQLFCEVADPRPGREELVLRACPQLRSVRARMEYRTAEQGVTLSAKQDLYSLDQLGFLARMRKGDMLIIGPGEGSFRPHSVGGHLLISQRGGLPFETLWVLIPTLHPMTIDGEAPPGVQLAADAVRPREPSR
jgi:hypothetical protein